MVLWRILLSNAIISILDLKLSRNQSVPDYIGRTEPGIGDKIYGGVDGSARNTR